MLNYFTHLTNFKHFGSSACSHVHNQSHDTYGQHETVGLNLNMWTCWRSRVFEIRQMGKVVQHRENILNSRQTNWLIKRCCMSSNTNCNTYIKLTTATTAPRWWYPKITLFTKKWAKRALNEKVCVFAIFHFNNLFVTPGHIPALLNFLDPILSELSHSQSPSIPEHIFKIWKPIRKLIL